MWLFVTRGEKGKLGFLKPPSWFFSPGVIRIETHISNVVVPTFLQETEKVFEAGCCFYLSHQFLIRVKDIWKGPSRGTVSARLFASLGEQEQSSQNTICIPNMSRVAWQMLPNEHLGTTEVLNDPHSTSLPHVLYPGGTAGAEKSHPSKASSFFKVVLQLLTRQDTNIRSLQEWLFPFLGSGKKSCFGDWYIQSLHPLTSPPLPWFATWRQINVIQAPLPCNISAWRIPSHLPTDPCQQSKPRALLMVKAEISVRWARPPAATVAEESA